MAKKEHANMLARAVVEGLTLLQNVLATIVVNLFLDCLSM